MQGIKHLCMVIGQHEGVFDRLQIRKILNDQNFIKVMNKKQKAAWTSFKNIMENFPGNHKSDLVVQKEVKRHRKPLLTQIIKCAYSASVTARTGADYASRLRSPRYTDASSYATHIAGT